MADQELPEEIIHHIFSFMTTTEAAQTSVLSRAWFSAWQTRPDIDFDISRYEKLAHIKNNSSKFAKEVRSCTMKFFDDVNSCILRYNMQEIGIRRFNLRVTRFVFPKYQSRINKWIKIALENGVKSLELNLHSYTLPLIVLQAAKSVVDLSLGGCNLKGHGNITCHQLQRLHLSSVHLDEVMFQNIISKCPLIEDLKLLSCTGMENIKVTTLEKLKLFCIFFNRKTGKSVDIEVEAPNLEFFTCTCEGVVQYNGAAPVMLTLGKCGNLKKLELSRLDITDTFFFDLDDKLPNIEDLSICNCNRLRGLRILSSSLKRLELIEGDSGQGLDNSWFVKFGPDPIFTFWL